MSRNAEVFLFGAGIVDVLAQPVSAAVFQLDSVAANAVTLSTGGDALNEATVLSRLGHGAALRTVLGMDEAAELVLAHLRKEGVIALAERRAELATGVNIVLVDEKGERRFITNPGGSLRKLSLADVLAALDTPEFESAKIATLASIFVSPELNASDMETLFCQCRQAGKFVCADMTRPKRGETLSELKGALRHLDWLFPNASEACAVTGCSEATDAANALLNAGVKHVAMKLGGSGCLIASQQGMWRMPAVSGVRAIDTTGAGDTFAAAFQAALLEGGDEAECAAFANAAASLCVEAVGATGAAMNRDRICKRAADILRIWNGKRIG